MMALLIAINLIAFREVMLSGSTSGFSKFEGTI